MTRVCRLARRLMQQYCAASLRLQRGQPQEPAGSQTQADGPVHQPGTGKLLLRLPCYETYRTACTVLHGRHTGLAIQRSTKPDSISLVHSMSCL